MSEWVIFTKTPKENIMENCHNSSINYNNIKKYINFQKFRKYLLILWRAEFSDGYLFCNAFKSLNSELTGRYFQIYQINVHNLYWSPLFYEWVKSSLRELYEYVTVWTGGLLRLFSLESGKIHPFARSQAS